MAARKTETLHFKDRHGMTYAAPQTY
jgi:hypothetical protein